MIACDLGRMTLLLSLPLASLAGVLSLAFLHGLILTCGVLTVLFNVAYRSTLPRLLTEHQLVDGNAKLTMSQDLGELVGPSIGGVLIGVLGAARTFFANALAYLTSAVTLWMIRAEPVDRSAGAPEERRPLRAELTEGIVFISRHPILRSLLLCSTTSNFFVMASGAIEVTFMVRELDAPSWLVGVVYSISAVGGLVIGALSRRISERVGSARIIWVAMVAPGPLYLCMPLAQPGWGVLLYGIGLAAFSANIVLYSVAATSYRQRVTPAHMLGRVNASVLWICYGAIPLGSLTGGGLASTLGLRTALWICVLGTWSAALWVFFSPLRTMRNLPESRTVPEPEPEFSGV